MVFNATFNNISVISWLSISLVEETRVISTSRHFQNGHHNTAKIQHCSISKVAFDLFFKPVVSGRET
jgi:hypothetical protein